jgi:DNA-binding NarL/FixJ family response regulator
VGAKELNMPLRVLICDELPIVRDGLQMMLDAEPDVEVVKTTESGIDAIMSVRSLRPDVVITGLALRGLAGLEMIRRLSREELSPRPGFVVFSMTDSDEVIDAVLQAGVNGLLVRDATREEVNTAIRAAAKGQTMLSPAVAQRLVTWFRSRGGQPDPLLCPSLAELTAREREVLLLIARGMSVEEMSEQLTIGMTTVRTHLYRLRCKLNVRDRAQLVSFAYRAGLMSSEHPVRTNGDHRARDAAHLIVRAGSRVMG